MAVSSAGTASTSEVLRMEVMNRGRGREDTNPVGEHRFMKIGLFPK